MIRLEELPRCPTGRKGRHSAFFSVPDELTRWYVWTCGNCGITRMIPAEFQMPEEASTMDGSLDALDGETIRRWMGK